MIIELFGPPGAGKTTFARTLAARLRERDYTVDLILSYRPVERSPSESRLIPVSIGRRMSFAAQRLIRPLSELLSMIARPRGISRDLGTALNLIKILPPSSALSSVRLLQYLSRLSHAWFRASAMGKIIVFDQAFVQAVCSLALLCDVTDEVLIAYALDFVPKPDLLVHLDAPLNILEERLRDRHHVGGKIECLLEQDLETSLSSRNVVELLHKLLTMSGWNVVSTTSLDKGSLETAVEQIERQVASIAGHEKRDMPIPLHIETPSPRRDTLFPDSFSSQA